ncbi:unnamed protein product [Bursaphelenchus okinawaensis]|uniref:Uncharacterized protein n=1 Tax=Bursaphelenchus okinawaensis TaxID=465554 RepID=A0A811KPQ2_9BILA|nr:unnamed protein product [Bursaphelenchus okinawaensis]CAG9110513.1 unnamed protein product [Bursaphelenchus okinawaensis]
MSETYASETEKTVTMTGYETTTANDSDELTITISLGGVCVILLLAFLIQLIVYISCVKNLSNEMKKAKSAILSNALTPNIHPMAPNQPKPVQKPYARPVLKPELPKFMTAEETRDPLADMSVKLTKSIENNVSSSRQKLQRGLPSKSAETFARKHDSDNFLNVENKDYKDESGPIRPKPKSRGSGEKARSEDDQQKNKDGSRKKVSDDVDVELDEETEKGVKNKKNGNKKKSERQPKSSLNDASSNASTAKNSNFEKKMKYSAKQSPMQNAIKEKKKYFNGEDDDSTFEEQRRAPELPQLSDVDTREEEKKSKKGKKLPKEVIMARYGDSRWRQVSSQCEDFSFYLQSEDMEYDSS